MEMNTTDMRSMVLVIKPIKLFMMALGSLNISKTVYPLAAFIQLSCMFKQDS